MFAAFPPQRHVFRERLLERRPPLRAPRRVDAVLRLVEVADRLLLAAVRLREDGQVGVEVADGHDHRTAGVALAALHSCRVVLQHPVEPGHAPGRLAEEELLEIGERGGHPRSVLGVVRALAVPRAPEHRRDGAVHRVAHADEHVEDAVTSMGTRDAPRRHGGRHVVGGCVVRLHHDRAALRKVLGDRRAARLRASHARCDGT